MRAQTGELVDAACEHASRDSYRVHQIIDTPVVRFEIIAPSSFTLYFESGHALTGFDDLAQYESFSVHLKGGGSEYV